MNKIFGIKAIVISNYYNFACGNIASKPTVLELEQGGPLGGLAHWAVNPSKLALLTLDPRRGRLR